MQLVMESDRILECVQIGVDIKMIGTVACCIHDSTFNITMANLIDTTNFKSTSTTITSHMYVRFRTGAEIATV